MLKYLSFIKFSHTIFALPFALIGFFLAVGYHGYELEWKLFILVILCMVFARSAAMAFNRVVDRKIDRENPRTAGREIPTGKIPVPSAILFILINSLLFIICAGLINFICFLLSPVALLIILGYSYTKRFTFLSHFILGIGLSLAPIGSYLAVSGRFNWLPLMFSGIVIFWVSGFDIIYALQDETFDREQKLKSLPARFGKKSALDLARLFHFFCFIMVVAVGYFSGMGFWFWIGAGIFGASLIYQHLIISPNDLRRVNLAFFTTNGFASILLATGVILAIYFS